MDPSTNRQEILGEIARRPGAALVYLFGSQAQAGARYLRGEEAVAESGSDLDVGVVFFHPPASAVPIYGEIYAELTHLFEPFRVDLVFLHEVNAIFRYEAILGECVYAASDAFQEEFEERTMKEAADLKFKKRIFDQEVLEAIRDGYFEVKL